MKVAFDARYLNAPASGVGTYVENVLRAMLRVDSDIHFVLVTRRPGLAERFDRERCSELIFDYSPPSIVGLLRLGGSAAKASCDLFHGTFNIIPSGMRSPVVVTTHDIMQLQNPANISRAGLTAQLFWRVRKRHAIYHADHIVASSHATRDAILERYDDVPFERITVAPLAADPYYFEKPSPEATAAARSLVGTDAPFVLTVGNESPHKNHYRAVEAFRRASLRIPQLKLVLVRRFGRDDPRLDALLATSDVAEKVVLLDRVEKDELRALYGEARSFFFPSWVEGFGLPILEAMACGCPVITSDRSAPAEVAGDAAVLVSPFEETQMADAIVRLEADDPLRKRMIDAGRSRAEKFTWDTTAVRTIEAYRRIAGT